MNFTQPGNCFREVITWGTGFSCTFSEAGVSCISPNQNNVATHPVSVIICARDEAANLVKKSSHTHEVIVVDDNSFDDSKYLLEELQKTYKQLHVVLLKQEAKFIPGKNLLKCGNKDR